MNNMDREISKNEQRKGSWKKYLGAVVIICTLIIAYFGMRHLLSKKVEQDALHIATVQRGDIENTLTASGTIVSIFERQINAPVTTEISSVLLRTGTDVKKGDLILQLDQEYTQLEYDKLKDQLELKENNIQKLKLQFDKDLVDLDLRDQIKALELAKQSAQVSDQKRLFEIGGATQEEVERAELALKVGNLEKKMLENELKFLQQVNTGDKRNLELEFLIQEKNLKELKRKLSETDVRANEDGVITWINESIGKTVQQGEPLVRIADLSQFRVEAMCADRYAGKIFVGQTVNVKIGKKNIIGKVERILPEVVNKTIRFLVSIDNSTDIQLRPNMQTDVYIVTDKSENVLKLKKGSGILGVENQDVFRVVNDIAYRVPIRKGLSNSQYIEIKEGLEEGDRVIISGTDDYKHLDQFNILKNQK